MMRGFFLLASAYLLSSGLVHAQETRIEMMLPRTPMKADGRLEKAQRQAEAEKQKREAAEADAREAKAQTAELKRKLAEAERKAQENAPPKLSGGGQPTHNQLHGLDATLWAQPKVSGGGQSTPAAAASYAPLSVFRDKLSDGSLGPEMVVIPAGEFDMGSNEYKDEKPIRKVKIGRAFALGKTEVTQAQWRQVMGGDPAEWFKGCDDCPVESVSWDDAQAYIKKLSALTGKQYRLPSEAEWEYAAKAGNNYKYAGGDDLDAVAWYWDNSDMKTHPVGRKQKNAWGLYDMSGNVWEWVEDVYHDSYQGAPTDGSTWVTGGEAGRRVLRGGSWVNWPGSARAADRNWGDSTYRSGGSGFRLARMLP